MTSSLDPNYHHYDQMVDLLTVHFGLDRELKGCDIGIDKGCMEGTLLNAFPLLEIIGIDRDACETRFKDERFYFIQERSDDAVKHFTPEQFDFVYIDGDHEQAQVKTDISNYLPFIKKDGIIAGHDYTETAWGVKRAVDSVFKETKINLGKDLTWWVFLKDIKW